VPATAPVRHYRFDGFVVDAVTRELRDRHGASVPLTARAFDVLLLLLRHRDRVVGKDELLSTVWAGRVVEENNLTQAISALRRALGTGAGDHRYIVTVPGRGYRFVAQVEEGGDARPAGGAPGVPKQAPPLRPGQRVVLPALLALLGLVVVATLWWARRASEVGPPVPEAATADAPLALAVLPFRTLPEESPRDELLELGLADTLITRIAGSTALRVSPLASSQRFAGAGRDPAEAARQLGVAYVVEGAVQRHGERVKVNVRLLAADGHALWTGSFDEYGDRIFTLQDRIAGELASVLAIRVAAATRRSPCDGADAEAYRAYLSGQYRLARPSAESARQALSDFRRALDRDPTCARAYAAMANAYRTLVATADAEPNDTFARAKALVERALSLDPNLPEAHLMHGWIAFWHDWDWAASEAAFGRAIELSPSLADAYFGHAHLLRNIGRVEEARARAREAMTLDPLSPVINAIGGTFVAPPGESGRYLDRALELDPDYWLALLMRGSTRVASGDREGGLADLGRARELCGDCGHALVVRGQVEARLGNLEATRALLRELEARGREGYVAPTALASLRNALGDTGAALDLLERGWRERDIRMSFLLLDLPIRWNNLRDEPRFRELMARMDLPLEPARQP
jgi:DNA-binding winged helix-turn-helix (wHTH) protein/TolB-like protein/Tfp pilus assembly protein PilF